MTPTKEHSSHRQVEPIKVLLIDDDDDDVRLVTKSLSNNRLFVDITRVEDGLQALAYLHQSPPYQNGDRPDLILLDLNMPRMDGRETLREIKGDPRLQQIPVVVLTSSDDDRDILTSYDQRANSFVTKPLDLHQFQHVLNELKQYWFCVVKLPASSDATTELEACSAS